MLTATKMAGMKDMGAFYNNCLHSLYPPGSCGALCNEHTYECYIEEIRESCCDERGASSIRSFLPI